MMTRNYELYLPLITQTVSKFCRTNKYITNFTTKDDLIQDMYFVFAECDKIFNSQKGVPFEAFLCKRCQYELYKIWRKNKRLLSFDDIDDQREVLCVEDKTADLETIKEILIYIKEDANSGVLADYFIKEMTQKDLAEKYQTNITKINRIIQEFIKETKEIYNEI